MLSSRFPSRSSRLPGLSSSKPPSPRVIARRTLVTHGHPRLELGRVDRAALCRFVEAAARAISVELCISWDGRRARRSHDDAASAWPSVRAARGALAPQLPQVCPPRRGAGRFGVELADAGAASWPADTAAGLDLLALRRAALRDRVHR